MRDNQPHWVGGDRRPGKDRLGENFGKDVVRLHTFQVLSDLLKQRIFLLPNLSHLVLIGQVP